MDIIDCQMEELNSQYPSTGDWVHAVFERKGKVYIRCGICDMDVAISIDQEGCCILSNFYRHWRRNHDQQEVIWFHVFHIAAMFFFNFGQ